jgi:hypothetical protein
MGFEVLIFSKISDRLSVVVENAIAGTNYKMKIAPSSLAGRGLGVGFLDLTQNPTPPPPHQ